MDIREAQKQLMNLLLVAVQTGVRVMYLFSVEDRLYVIYEGKDEGPQVFVLEDSGAIFRTLAGTMEDRRGSTLESGHAQEWCLDMTVAGGKAHFDMTMTGMVVVRIIAPTAGQSEDDVEIDERELAEAITGLVEEAPPPAPEKTPQDHARAMIDDILMAKKPFPKEVIEAMPPAMTQRLEIVPIMFIGTALAVAVGDAGLTADAQAVLARDLITVNVDDGRFKELLMCYRTDPRHKR